MPLDPRQAELLDPDLRAPARGGELERRLADLERQLASTRGWVAGDVKASAKAAADPGWLLCNGAAVSRAAYDALFAAISTAYGAGDGSATFNLPDLRGRVPVGEDATGVRLANAAGRDRGEAGGAERVAIADAELPTHTHTMGGNVAFASAGDSFVGRVINLGSTHWGVGTGSNVNNISNASSTGGKNGTSGQSHQNMPPYQVLNYFIKT